MQLDDGTPQTSYYMPATPSGSTEPDGWDDWVSNSIIEVPVVFPVQPGAHTLKVWMIEPTVVLQKIVIGMWLFLAMRCRERLTGPDAGHRHWRSEA